MVQETIFSVAKSIREFEYKPESGKFKNWLLQATRWRIADYFRRQQARPDISSQLADDGTGTPALNRVPDSRSEGFDAVWNADWERNLMDAAIERVKQRVKPLQYQMFDCFVLKNWPMGEVMAQLGVNAGQVYFAKHKLSRLVKRELISLKRQWS